MSAMPFLAPLLDHQERLQGSTLINSWQPLLETLGQIDPIAELSEHTHHFSDLSQGEINIEKFEEDFNQLEPVRKTKL
ncbi:hypothetical protein [Piscirickettsia litoralis]|uniref:Uncharacterized protein n=1 Tax=Piscirickettsia litoralis TaxID=1891921 RepID=A0ABX3A026_9GAMM|nr:hypothetical protein [Piscirickettsia litoralis]ODN42207.1 hypothetical protein BGC07_03730 [Piscirickettsia litoralis]